MLFMIFLVLTTGVMLINIHVVFVVLAALLLLALDIVTITKLWDLLDRCKKGNTKDF